MEIVRASIDEVLASLRTSRAGLTDAEARRRLEEFGPNRIEEIPRAPLWLRFLREFTHFFALILWVAAALALLSEWRNPGSGMWQLAIAILAVIVVNGVFSFLQEYRAERALVALRELLPAGVKLLRDGTLQSIDGHLVVPGDVLLLEEGDRVPADCRLIEAAAVRVNLATVTGESQPQPRTAEATGGGAPLEARNVLLAGTAMLSGHARAVAYATGMRTEFGRIARLTQTVGEAGSPLQREIARLSRVIATIAMALGLAFFVVGMLAGLSPWHNAMFAIGIIVANVPEGLLPTVTLSLAMATQRMARRNALVRHLPSVETLGSTTVICTDKTGTLTQNSMSVREAYAQGGLHIVDEPACWTVAGSLARVARHCHHLRWVRRNGADEWLGDPMEVALVRFAQSVAPEEPATQTDELPFDGDRRRMSVVVDAGGRRWLLCKGAPEAVLAVSDRIEVGSQDEPLGADGRANLAAAQEAMAGRGLRVLGFARRELAAGERPEERDLVFVGLIGLRDPPRAEVTDAIARCRTAGIRVIMLTGDHPNTAVAIAREIGLVRSESPAVVHGSQLGRMTRAQLQMALESPEIIFTRVSAEQKMLVVEALKSKGHVVAVTGDGVNDAPALKSADIGIAMGLTGTDVAKEAADMVLLDDNFASIVNAVEEGRAVYQNIRKFLTYILTSNVPELVPYLAYVLLSIPLPLTIIQILAVDLGTDMLPALALGAEPPGRDLMRQPPRGRHERLMSAALLARAYLWLGPLQAAAAMTSFFFVLHQGGWSYGDSLAPRDPLYLQATTACLAAIVAAQVVNVFACRDPRTSMFRFGWRANPLLLAGVAAEVVMVLAIVYTPFGHAAFGTAPLGSAPWLLMIALAIAAGMLEDVRKLAARRQPASG